MVEEEFVTTKGDEFILSIAADNMKASIKNSGAYIHRFWTGYDFRLVSTCYEYNRITILHLPTEKEHGMIKMYDRYIQRGVLPTDNITWKIFRLSRIPLFDYLKKGLRKVIMTQKL